MSVIKELLKTLFFAATGREVSVLVAAVPTMA